MQGACQGFLIDSFIALSSKRQIAILQLLLLLLLQDSLINQHQRIRSTLLRTVVGPEFSVLRTDVVKFTGPEIELQLRITRKRLKDAIDTIAYELQILSDKL